MARRERVRAPTRYYRNIFYFGALGRHQTRRHPTSISLVGTSNESHACDGSILECAIACSTVCIYSNCVARAARLSLLFTL